jgi:hypothetical protein
MITQGVEYDEQIVARTSPAALARKIANLKKRAQVLGFELVKSSEPQSCY